MKPARMLARRAGDWLDRHERLARSAGACRIHALALSRVCGRLGGGDRAAFELRLAGAVRDDDVVDVDPVTARLAAAAVPAGHPRPREVAAAVGLDADRAISLFLAGPAGHRRAVALIEAASAYGTRPLPGAGLCAELAMAAALRGARHFDLFMAARGARAALYVGDAPRALADAIRLFFRTLQLADGSFVSPTRLSPAARQSPELGFVLAAATGLQALWTLAELGDPALRLMPPATVP